MSGGNEWISQTVRRAYLDELRHHRTLRERVSTVFAGAMHELIGLIREVVFKLFAANYAVEFPALSRVAVATLILGKVIPMLEWGQSGYRFDSHRRAVVIACKTLIYGLVVFVLAIGEKIFHAVREAGSLRGGISFVIANASLNSSLRHHTAV
jgi:hypothetical protein